LSWGGWWTGPSRPPPPLLNVPCGGRQIPHPEFVLFGGGGFCFFFFFVFFFFFFVFVFFLVFLFCFWLGGGVWGGGWVGVMIVPHGDRYSLPSHLTAWI